MYTVILVSHYLIKSLKLKVTVESLTNLKLRLYKRRIRFHGVHSAYLLHYKIVLICINLLYYKCLQSIQTLTHKRLVTPTINPNSNVVEPLSDLNFINIY